MYRIGRPEDDFREKLTEDDIGRICKAHGLPRPTGLIPEYRGNETVCYHLDAKFFLAFVISEDVRRKVEGLSLLAGIKEIPTPGVIAWSENDPELHVPYMIVERCPGHRLDALWKNTTAEQHVDILEAFGAGTGRYHTVSGTVLRERARKLGLVQRVRHIEEPQSRDDSSPVHSLPTLAARLRRIGVEDNGIVKRLEAHYSRATRKKDTFVGPGLVHTEPFAEHFFIEKAGTGYRLSGCVDLGFAVEDSLGEITSHYVSMLSLEPAYFDAFKRGYERFFSFPPDAEERLHLGAIEHDLSNILWLLDTMEERPQWAFAEVWVSGHLRRLEGWLDPVRRVDRALFREDIGPW